MFKRRVDVGLGQKTKQINRGIIFFGALERFFYNFVFEKISVSD